MLICAYLPRPGLIGVDPTPASPGYKTVCQCIRVSSNICIKKDQARRRCSGLICAYLPRPGIEQPGPDGLTCRSPAGPGTPQNPALCAGRFAQNVDKITVCPIFLQLWPHIPR